MHRFALAAAALALSGCATRASSSTPCAAPTDAASVVASPLAYRYHVVAGPGAAELCVDLALPEGASSGGPYRLPPKLAPFVREVTLSNGVGSQAITGSDGSWLVPACQGSCRLSYRVLLKDAAAAFEDLDLALAYGGAVVAPPSSWMLRPAQAHGPFQLSVATAPGVSFTSGLSLSPADPRLAEGNVGALDDTPYAAFGSLDLVHERLPGATLDVAITAGPVAVSRPVLHQWVATAARAVASYFDGFPIPHAAVIVLVSPRPGISNGHTMGNGGGAVVLSVAESATLAELADDWILVHEMVHLSFPNVQRAWAEEGLATYLEPLIRTRAGLMDPDEMWRSMILGLPHGLPLPGEGGLDRTDTWGRRYWGGALFWFVADLEIRKNTAGRHSLDDALRGITHAGGNVSVSWDLDRTLTVGDRAAETNVLVPLRHKMGSAPVAVDLDALWKSLGVSLSGKRVVYDDTAPLAGVRRSLVSR